MQRGEKIHGFVVRDVTPLPDLHIEARELEHETNGARLLHLHTDDAENLFSVVLPTPPADDTGLPHIMEHSVLCGSRTFPVRGPFFEMRRTSMATFINAMTAPDHTVYAVASNVRADLRNLAKVCADAVFHPLLREATFRSQAHHLVPEDPKDPDGPWTITGIVYNEMRGALSSPERRLLLLEDRLLVPDTPHARFAGGDPAAMPDLTYEDFLAFHREHYHPSRALFFAYGDLETAAYAACLEPSLAEFARRSPAPPGAPQPRWSAPLRAHDSWPARAGDGVAERSFLLLSWLWGDARDVEDVARLVVLADLLVGHEGAPLRRALASSGLGADLVVPGFEDVGADAAFRVALRDADGTRTDDFEALVLDTLRAAASRGFAPEDVEAAIDRLAFRHRERTERYPVDLLWRVAGNWVRGGDPLDWVRAREHLERLRREADMDRGLFPRLVRMRLLDNPHRLTLTLVPDPGGAEAARDALQRRVRPQVEAMSSAERRRLAAEGLALEREFAEPNPPEVLATLPRLRLDDLPRVPVEIPTSVERIAPHVDLLVNDVFGNGVEYLHLDFDLGDLPDPLWRHVARYADAVRKMGTARMDYATAARRAAACTGGIGCQAVAFRHATDATGRVRGLRLEVRALGHRMPEALELLRELFFEIDPADTARLREVTGQAHSKLRARMRGMGAFVAGVRAARGWSDEYRIRNELDGLPQLDLLARHARGDAPPDGLASGIAAVRDLLLRRRRITASFTGSRAGTAHVREALAAWGGAMKGPPAAVAPGPFDPWATGPREGLVAAIDTAHCAAVLPVPHFAHADAPLLELGWHLVQHGHLLPEIRFRGKAYGAQAAFDDLAGAGLFLSFRDPHITRTLSVFDGIVDHVRAAAWSREEIDHAILATAKAGHRPIRPAWATGAALTRHLCGLAPEVRRQRQDAMLTASPDDVRRAMLAHLEAALPAASVCVVASREQLEKANRELGARALTLGDSGV